MPFKILIVDDEPMIVEMLSIRLEEEGYGVLSADTGPGGIEKTKSQKPDLVLLDYTLPKLNGAKVAEALKSDPETSSIPIVLLSGYRREQIGGDDLRIDAFVNKPYVPDELLPLIEKLINASKLKSL